MGRRLVLDGLAARVVLVWGALGLVVGAAVAALVHLESRPATVDHGSYTTFRGGATSAYSSTLKVTFTDHDRGAPPLLVGVAIGLLAGLVVGLIISSIRSHSVGSTS